MPSELDAGRYRNPRHIEGPGALNYLWNRFMRRGHGIEWADPDFSNVPVMSPDITERVDTPPRITWLGHSTVLIQYAGVNILTDPLLRDYAGPFAVTATRRHTAPGLAAADLPPIDLVVISHDHYDHLDIPTIRALPGNPELVVPVGVDRVIERAMPSAVLHVFDWWQQKELRMQDKSVAVRALPSQHGSGRGLFDRNARLWASWRLRIADTYSVLFVGDSGYDKAMYAAIGAREGPFHLALLPIGSYLPRTHMASMHVNPREAVAIHTVAQVRCSIGVHWGSFNFAAEAALQPVEDLARAVEEAGLTDDAFGVMAIGQTVTANALPIEAAEGRRCWQPHTAP